MHAKLIRWLSAFNANPELLDGYLAVFRQRHNSDVSITHYILTLTHCSFLQVGYPNRYGEPWRLHYSPALMNEVDNLNFKVFGKSAYKTTETARTTIRRARSLGSSPSRRLLRRPWAFSEALRVSTFAEPSSESVLTLCNSALTVLPVSSTSSALAGSRVPSVGPCSLPALAAASTLTRIHTPSHIFITKALCTRTNVGPIRTSAKQHIFYFELKHLRGSAPSNVSRDQGSVEYLTWLFDKPPRWAHFCKALNAYANILRGERAIAYHLPNQVRLPVFLSLQLLLNFLHLKVASVYAICKKAAQTKSSVRALAPDLSSLNNTPASRAPHPQPAAELGASACEYSPPFAFGALPDLLAAALEPCIPRRVHGASGPRLPLMPSEYL